MARGSNRQRGFRTRAIHHAYDPADHLGSVSPPVFMTSTYAFASVAESEQVMAEERDGYLYGRERNPTQALLEARLAELEGAEACVVTASGMAAIGSLFLSLLSQGDELVIHPTVYSNTVSVTGNARPRFGIRGVTADMRDLDALAAAIGPRTKLVYMETPINPTAEVLDIAAVARVVHARGARLVVDSTFASPAVQRPIEHGADIVVHSLTKYINGHGDLLGGAVLGDAATIREVRGQGLRYITGATLSPLSCFLVMRGLKTLGLRMRAHSEAALAVARMLAGHPAVAVVRYPYLPGSPGHEAALRQMDGGSAMLSVELKDGFAGAVRFMDRLELFQRAV
ncbi:MAG: trans-sulfuration enzyme family protein, partial [Alphaproteobacteria bacterium]